MRVPLPFSRSISNFLCTVGRLLYSGIGIPSESSSSANYTSDPSQCTPALTSYRNSNNSVVSLNYCCLDVEKTFASHLSYSLNSHGQQLGIIETAFVHIPIFTKNYAKSSCCLNRLLVMLKSGMPIIPVFYDVKPDDLDCQEMFTPGVLYDKHLRMLEEEKTFDPQTGRERPRYDPNIIMEWRKALSHVSGICGFELAAYNGDEGRLIHDLVKHVVSMRRVPKTAIPYYDVFLSHRGKDVKNTLASNLYYRLRDHKLQVFFDKEEMQKGSRINSVIEKAINISSIHIVIFSANYAQSEWCLDELVLMIESGSIIIPVFYDVKPTDMWWNPVDGRNGVYAEALRILEEEKTFDPQTQQIKPRYKSSTIEKWKKALMEVTGREGLKLETYDGDEGKLVDMVVRQVVKYASKGRRGNFLRRSLTSQRNRSENHENSDKISRKFGRNFFKSRL